ncbi:MAG: M1 family metallopeptidase [Actinomycetota bacterium]
MPSDPYRLPDTVRPSEYRITIRPDLDDEVFGGRVAITAEVTETIDEVVLNSDGLTIGSASITRADDGPAPCAHELDTEHERLILRPSAPLEPGPITVEIDFDGRFNENLVGLYLSRYTDDAGVEHKLATTQFEATHARMCFPCWDEPEYKASFAISLDIDAAHQAVANGPEVDREDLGDGRVRIDFAPTMVMSTYLVAFVTGSLEITDPVDADGVPIRVVHVPGKDELTPYALEVAVAGLRYLTDYFGLPYPDQKIDLVAIPDFAFGAMENVGCVIFREAALLIDTDRATQPELQRIADVINHELAHMWFGDLVTMSWWNGLWLNEAFATFMEMLATDAFRPEWDRWTDFALSRTAAFDTDALSTTRPIEYEVVSPADAEGMFDILTYEKGAAVVRMLEQYLGPDRFRDGIQQYMRQHQFSNADTTDLWDALEAETGEPVRRIMDSWIFQGGFPLLSLDLADGKPTLSQQPMAYAGAGDSTERSWVVPLRYRWQAEGAEEPTAERVLIDDPTPSALPLDHTPEWLVLNAESASFVRIAYPADHLMDLAHLDQGTLGAAERYALVDDAWASVLAGETSSMAFLGLLEAMTAETNRSVWVRLISGFRSLRRLTGGEARERLEEITHDALSPALAFHGLAPDPDDDDQRRQLRGDLVRAMGNVANDPDIQEEAKRAVATGRRDPELVDPALLAASVEVVASIGDEADFDDFVAAWKAATTPQDELRYLGALCDFPEPELVARLHPMILDGDVRGQNAPMLLRRALLNPAAGHQTWEFITTNWDRLVDAFAASLVVRMCEGLVGLDQPDDAEAAAAFFADHPVPTGARTLEQILERQRVQVALRQREAERLSRFLIT